MRPTAAWMLIAALLLAGSAGAARRPPNVLLVVTDDQRWDQLATMPVVSALAARGVRFTNAFVPTSLCCPSRVSILTGLYAHTHGVHTLGPPPSGGALRFVGGDRSTIATWLHAAGYRTGLFGKYLNGYSAMRPPPGGRWYIPPGWDAWQAFVAERYYEYELVGADGATAAYGNAPSDYSTDVLRDRVVAFIRDALRSGRPFFALFTPFAPHVPLPVDVFPTPAPRHLGALAGLPPFRPPNFLEPDVSDKPAVRDWTIGPWLTPIWLDIYRERTLESLLAVDEAVSAMLEAVREEGGTRDTIVIFTSDNGFLLGEHRLLAKPYPYEECHRVPLVVSRVRGHGRPREDHRLVLNIDIAPTIADFARVAHPGVDGRSLRPLLERRRARWRHAFPIESWYWIGPQLGALDYRGVRTERWAYIEYPAFGAAELYDLRADPYELENMAPRAPGVVRRLHRRVLALHAGN